MTAPFSKMAAALAAVSEWWAVNLAALVADDESPCPKSVFATSPMWWGELLNVPEEE